MDDDRWLSVIEMHVSTMLFHWLSVSGACLFNAIVARSRFTRFLIDGAGGRDGFATLGSETLKILQTFKKVY